MKEAAEQGLIALRTMRGMLLFYLLRKIRCCNSFVSEAYVAELMKNKTSGHVPKIAKYRSADVSAAYVLVCNYTDTNSKIVCTVDNWCISLS